MWWDVDVVEKFRRDADRAWCYVGDNPLDDLAFERAEDYETDFDVHVYEPSPMADEAVADLKEVVHADAEPDLLDDLVRVFLVDLVFDFIAAAFVELEGGYLNEV